MTDKNDLTEYKKIDNRGELYRIDENGNKQTIGYFTSAEIYCPSQPILDLETSIKKANNNWEFNKENKNG